MLKILQYMPGLPPVMGGGMIKYALDLIYGESQAGHEVIMLVPGHFTYFHRDQTRIIKQDWNGKECYRIINSLPVSGGKGVQNIAELIKRGNREIYIEFLKDIKPDVVHIHSFMGMHIAFLEAAAWVGIPTVYTTHDYYGICPGGILLSHMEQCVVTDGSQCPLCIDKTVSIRKLRRQQSVLYEKLKNNSFTNFLENSQKLVPIKIFIRSLLHRRKNAKTILDGIQNIQREKEYRAAQHYYREMFTYITKFHFNSSQSEKIFSQCLGKITGDIILISNRSISDRRKKRSYGKTLRIGFIGREAYKGFDLLKAVLAGLYEKGLQDFECHIYFNPKEKLPSYIISHAPYSVDTVEQVYDGMDVLVLPSLWKETYGFVVLEALSYGIPVIVSQNVGAKEWLTRHDGMGIVVQATEEALQKSLENIYCNREILRQMNLQICNCELELSFEQHISKIVDMYRSIA